MHGDPLLYHLRPADSAALVGLAGLLRLRGRPMSDDIETELPDLAGLTLAEIAGLDGLLGPFRQQLIAQVEKPRPNIGSGPPGRAD